MTGYDFIGDVHGQGLRLEALLTRLGYERKQGTWKHPSRIAVFVGDYVDRGPEQLATLSIVRGMTESGAALAVMGNHEHNAIGWLTPDPHNPDEYCRRRVSAHRKQHEDFLREVEGSPETHAQWIAWMRELPVILELGDVRVTHACWDESWVNVLRTGLDSTGRFTPEGLAASLTKGTALFTAMEIVTKGVEVKLPAGSEFVDPLGKRRDALRVAWWRSGRTFRDLALPFPGVDLEAIPDAPVHSAQLPTISEKHLHVFGHYWMTGAPAPLQRHLSCIDYSGATGRPLTAYRYDGEAEFDASKYVQV